MRNRIAHRSVSGGPEQYSMMEQAVALTRELLREDGCLFLHVDWRVAGDLRAALTACWAARLRQRNYMAYERRRTTTHFSASTIRFFYTAAIFFDPDAIGNCPRPQRRTICRGVDDDGRVYYAINSADREYRYYEDEPVYPGDGTDISHLQKDPERQAL